MNKDNHNLCNLYMENITPYYDVEPEKSPELPIYKSVSDYKNSPSYISQADIKDDLKTAINLQPVKMFNLIQKSGSNLPANLYLFKNEYNILSSKLDILKNFTRDTNLTTHIITLVNEQIYNNTEFYNNNSEYKKIIGEKEENKLPFLSFRVIPMIIAIDKWIKEIDGSKIYNFDRLMKYRSLLINFVKNQNPETFNAISTYASSNKGNLDKKFNSLVWRRELMKR